MNQKKSRAAMVFSWHKSFAILAPWRRGKGNLMLDSEVVLTKVKLFNNFQEKKLLGEDSVSTISVTMSEQDVSAPVNVADANTPLQTGPQQHLAGSKPDYLSAIFSNPLAPMIYKFESEDSGVELPSGANSPSTPTGSEQSFVVHSRESSCDSTNRNSAARRTSRGPRPPPRRTSEPEEMEEPPAEALDLEECDLTESEVGVSAHAMEEAEVCLSGEGTDGEKSKEGGLTPEDCEESSELLEVEEEEAGLTDQAAFGEPRPQSQASTGACDDMAGVASEQPLLRKSSTSASLDEYMEECCRLSEVHQAKAPPRDSGLGYLEHICRLIEKIGQLQEHNLKLQKQICSMQKEGRKAKSKEDFFLQHCSCGAVSLVHQEPGRFSRGDFLHGLNTSSGTLSDLSTIPEVMRHTARTGPRDGEGGCPPLVPLWRRGLNRRSYTEGEAVSFCDGAEVASAPHRRLTENHTWGRVKDLVKKTRLRPQSMLGLSSSSLKRSCPQLYRPDLGSVELTGRNRNSMIALGHQTKLDFLWQQ